MIAVTLLVLAAYFGALAVLAVFALHRLHLLVLLRRADGQAADAPTPCASLPLVTVQLPIYNERFVIGRLLDAVGRLDYPAGRLEVQLLDDSSDATTAVAAAHLAGLRRRGVRALHVRRGRRDGYKAGALAAGLARARGELVLILDADFVPPPDLIQRLLPHFDDPRVGMVQARWGHLNAGLSRLTRIQALLLDAHFLIETAARARAGLFFNFHGTAGMWRRAAIEDAGGWRADTLTEDLDLSYRAQMRGWQFVFASAAVVPAELPASFAAFKQQQARWAQGTIATARRILPVLLRGHYALAIKLEAIFHLTSHVVYPATLVAAITLVPALLLRRAVGWHDLFWIDVLLGVAAIAPVSIFYTIAARRSELARLYRGFRVPLLLFVGGALAVSSTRAVLAGLRERGTVFLRTPKVADRDVTRALPPTYSARSPGHVRWLEGALALYLAACLVLATSQGLPGALPFLAVLGIGFGGAAVRS